ncbi:PPA1309 family protein [Saccharopolyspora gloriosae]
MERMSAAHGEDLAAALPGAAREIEDFVAAAGWDQPTQVFALVPTEQLLAAEPNLADEVDGNSPLTPIAQESLPAEDLAEALSRIVWPEQVAGCALVQEIVVLPPEAEASLPAEDEQARNAAAEHPDRQEARLVAAVLRAGHETCVLRLRASGEEGEAGERVQDPSLAPNLLRALHETFAA